MGSQAEQEYVLGTHDAELVRLGFQHRVWSEQAFALWERAGFGPGQTLLDVGCGPGHASLDLARWVGPSGRIVAVDASPRFIEHLNRQRTAQGFTNIEAHVGDVQKLELPLSGIDGAYARWVLCFVSDPQAVVARVADMLRPGGVFAVQDYFNYRAMCVAPRSAAFDRMVAAIDESWRRRGGDPDVAGRLPAMMSACGMHVREIKPTLRLARPGSIVWHWPASFFSNYVPTLVSMGLLTHEDQAAFERDFTERAKDPSAFLTTPPVFDIIAIKR